MNHGSLFSGIGGFDLAAQWIGWNNIFHCEWNPFCQKILKYHFPNSISYEDITKTDFTIHRGKIDIITGGFPCQPYSLAGKRKGKEDERHLFPEMLRAIREIQPRWVVGENVFGIVNWNGGMVFNEVQSDLEAEGYEVQPFILPAVAVNAPHRRDRVWFIGYNASNANSIRLEQCENSGEMGGGQTEVGRQRCESTNAVEADGTTADVANTNSNRLQGSLHTGIDGKQRWDRQKQFAAKYLHPSNGHIQWEKFPTQSPICSGDDGIPTELDGITFSKWRQESIKGYGNAVVPQVVMQIFKTIEQFEHLNK